MDTSDTEIDRVHAVAPPGAALVRLTAALVPASRRAEWLAEWEAELHYAWREAARERRDDLFARIRLRARCLGALPDAFWLRRHHGARDMFGLDLKYAVRTLRRRPAFGTVVVLTLALGIGATTAIFSVVNGVLLRPLHFPEPDRLVRITGEPTDGDWEKVGKASSFPDFFDIRATAKSFSRLAAVRSWPVTLTGPGIQPVSMRTTYATSDLWPMLGATPVLGRALLPSDERPDAPAVVVLSYATWQGRFGRDAGILGRTITLDGQPITVVGVMPPGLRLTDDAQLWRPAVPRKFELERGVHTLYLIARLRAGVTVEQAAVEVKSIARRLELQYPSDNSKRGAHVEMLRNSMVADARPALLVLLGAVGLVLLIACTNLANLFLARGAAREREVAVRTALGAGRAQLLRQFLTESLLLTLAGGALGLAVAWGGMHALLTLVPRTLPRAEEVALDLPVLLFLLAVSTLTGLAFGVLPLVQLRRAEPSVSVLREGTRGATAGRARSRVRHALVVAEVALATVLVIGAALLVKSFWRLQTADLGFAPDGLLVAHVELPETRYDEPTKVIGFFERLRAEVDAIPGVRSASIAYETPIEEGWTSSYTIEGRDPPPVGHEPEARVRPVQPGYFRTVGVPIVRGRDVSPRDRGGMPGAVVVNEAFVRRHFPHEDPIGHRILRGSWWPGMPESFEIVGVVRDEPFLGVGTPADAATYFAHAQFPMADMRVIVRASGDPAALAAAVRERVWRLDPNIPVEDVRTMRQLLGASVAEPRFNSALLSLFAAAALALAAVGIYGVLSYTVAQRTNEIGVRMALGAERGEVLRLVVGQGAGVALIGIALGITGAVGLARVLTALLYGVSAHDPLVYGGVAALLTAVSLLAAYLPARRASRIDPVVALRYE
jgi:putative ABC transport system permease protein